MDYLLRALELADLALGRCSPNPAVGAVLVRDGLVVGEGYTQPPGGAHAEIMALRQAGEQARGATLYVSLEPCCHHGRTPPCTDALIAAGVREVHAATVDPNPVVNGRGIQALEQAGIAVHVGEHAEEARRLNQGFFKYVRTGLPFVTVKYAMTLDGKSATRSGDSRWISSEASRTLAHRLRERADAILTGIGTVLTDDPQLTVRLPPEARRPGPLHQPLRVVVDSQGRIPTTARLLQDEHAARTVVATTEAAASCLRQRLAGTGAEVLALPARNSRVDLAALMRELGRRGVLNVLVEAGGTLVAALLEHRLVDRLLVFVAPKIIGGACAPSPAGGAGVERMAEALAASIDRVERIGNDILIEASPVLRTA